MRNTLVHSCDRVDPSRIKAAIESELPKVIVAIEQLLAVS
jgi:uncharacterized protein with HEPN domain